MKFAMILMAASAATTPALADDIVLKPVIDARLRYENVDQDGIARKADAVTARVRAGIEATDGPWSVLAESEATLAIDNHYNSGVNGKTAFPIVADPQNVELNRLQVQYRGLPATVVTVGRQRINLDDQRFVGSVGWRDNEQTFDAARIEWAGIKGLKADVTYAWSDRTIYGIDGGRFNAPNRPQSIDGDNVFANLSYGTRYGTLTGFSYLIDEDSTVLALRQNSSQTYGGRFAGGAPLVPGMKLTYAASFARQSNYRNNPVHYHADYYLGELGVEAKGAKLMGGYEVLGSDGGAFGFQTPFATLHKFQGWADKFLVTPTNGVRDLYGMVGYTLPKVGPFAAVNAQAIYHQFDSDHAHINYGHEIDLQLSGKLAKRYTLLVKYADFIGKAAPTFRDTKKFWVALDFSY